MHHSVMAILANKYAEGLLKTTTKLKKTRTVFCFAGYYLSLFFSVNEILKSVFVFAFFLSFQAYTIQGQYAIPHPDVSLIFLFCLGFFLSLSHLIRKYMLIIEHLKKGEFCKANRE